MGKFKAKKVATPGSKVGRPKNLHKVSRYKKRGPYNKNYTKEDLEEALRNIEDNTMSMRAASKHFNIPKEIVAKFYCILLLVWYQFTGTGIGTVYGMLNKKQNLIGHIYQRPPCATPSSRSTRRMLAGPLCSARRRRTSCRRGWS